MANLIIPGAAAVAGFFIGGGATGAQIGWLLGSALMSDGNSGIAQPSIGDLNTTTSQYGSQIPYVIGKQRVAGNIIWADQKKSYTKTTGGSGKGGLLGGAPGVTTVGYTVNMLIGICQGPILGITRVWNAGKVIIDKPGSPLIGELYLGGMSQMPDPTYESVVGVGNAPAYRGLAYISLTNFDLGTSGVIPQFSFEVVKETVL